MTPGRNEPCPCGSGRKWKHCHGGSDQAWPRELARLAVSMVTATFGTIDDVDQQVAGVLARKDEFIQQEILGGYILANIEADYQRAKAAGVDHGAGSLHAELGAHLDALTAANPTFPAERARLAYNRMRVSDRGSNLEELFGSIEAARSGFHALLWAQLHLLGAAWSVTPREAGERLADIFSRPRED